jgi:hypothetical protein
MGATLGILGVPDLQQTKSKKASIVNHVSLVDDYFVIELMALMQHQDETMISS